MQRTFFVGDIHGCARTFKKMVEETIQLTREDVLYCVGDYIDRGPRSKEVVDYILALREKNHQVYTLRGNHEQMLLDARLGGSAHMLWMMNGGESTLRSFGVSSPDEIDEKYQAFFAGTEFYKTGKNFITVHAGLNFDAEDPFNDLESILWIRGYEVDRDFLNGRLLIHGHTPISKEQILSQPFEGDINIDGGCFYKSRKDLGNLIALDLDQKKFLETKNID